jgi:hypothetical protein
MILQVIQDDGGALKARIYSIDQGPTGDRADTITVQDSTIKFGVGMIALSCPRPFFIRVMSHRRGVSRVPGWRGDACEVYG